MGRKKIRVLSALPLVTLVVVLSAGVQLRAQAGGDSQVTDYRVGPQDVLTITSYDQADLSGKFTVEADGTFTFPLIGRVRAGGLTLRALEDALKTRLKDEGFFRNPQVTVAVETYKSQKIYVIGEVRVPGAVPLSGDMTLVEAIARAGSTLPSASGEAIIVHPSTPGAAGRHFLRRMPTLRRSTCGLSRTARRGQEPERIFVAAEKHEHSSGAVARGWSHRSGFHEPYQDRAHRQRRQEGAQGQAHRRRPARRHNPGRREIVLRYDPNLFLSPCLRPSTRVR